MYRQGFSLNPGRPMRSSMNGISRSKVERLGHDMPDSGLLCRRKRFCRYKDALHFALQMLNAPVQFQPLHARHPVVQQGETETTLHDRLQCSRAIVGDTDPVPQIGKSKDVVPRCSATYP